jgi:hypothetical protein
MKLFFQECSAPFSQMQVWQAVNQGYSFVIVLEEMMGKEFSSWSGYSLSWKKLPNGPVNKIPKPFYDSFEDAKKACEALADQVLK